jgi:glutathionylspermidine synthase
VDAGKHECSGEAALPFGYIERASSEGLQALSSRLCDALTNLTGSGTAWDLNKRLLEAKVYFGTQLLPSFPTPHLIERSEETRWASSIEQLMGVLEKVGARLLADRDLRTTLGFRAASNELFDIDPGFERLSVSSRLDVLWSDRDAKILEINADSPAMMTFTDLVEDLLLELKPWDELLAHGVRPRRRTKAMLEAILAAYTEWGGKRLDPTIAIVDWCGESTANELLHTARSFESLGCPTIVCDPRQLGLDSDGLHLDGRRIDIVQRRVLFPDFLSRRGDLENLITAYARGKVCMVNPLRSHMVGNKMALALLYQRGDELGLDEDDQRVIRELIPRTEVVTRDSLETLRKDRAQWVLKGGYGSGGKEVAFGSALSDAAWEAALEHGCTVPTIAQRRLTIPRLHLPTLTSDGQVRYQNLYANWNPWVFGGRYAGATTRVSSRQVVSITAGGGLLPSISL